MPSISFESELIDKGGASEPRCRRIALATQELDDVTASQIALLHKQVVRITVEYVD